MSDAIPLDPAHGRPTCRHGQTVAMGLTKQHIGMDQVAWRVLVNTLEDVSINYISHIFCIYHHYQVFFAGATSLAHLTADTDDPRLRTPTLRPPKPSHSCTE